MDWTRFQQDLARVVPHEMCVVALRDTSADWLTPHLAIGVHALRHPRAALGLLRLARVVTQSGEPLVLRGDVGAQLAALGVSDAPELRALGWSLVTPLRAGAETLGAVIVGSTRQSRTIDRHLTFLTALASQAAMALSAQRALAESERQTREWQALATLNHRLAAAHDPREAVQHVAHAALELLQADGAAVRLLDGETLTLQATAGDLAATPDAPQRWPARYLSLRGPASRALAANRVVSCPDVLTDPTLAPEMRDAMRAAGMRSCLIAPLRADGQPLGTITAVFHDPRLWDEADSRLLTALADQAALALRDARRRAELARSEVRSRLLAHAVAHAADGIVMVDPRGHYLTVNAAYAAILGYEVEELVGQSVKLTALLTPDYARERAEYWAIMESQGQWSGAVQRRHKQGHIVSCWLSMALIRDADGAPLAAVGILRDITDERKLEAQLAETEKLRALGELAAGVAHNLNNVLEVLLGRTDLLLAQSVEPEIDEHLRFMRQAAADGAAIVRRIQSFARTSPSGEPEPVEVAALLGDALAMAEPRWRDTAQRHGAEIEVSVDAAEPLCVLGNPSELREVLVNLINNAADAMPQGGALRVGGRRTGERVELWVEDTGIGMSPEVQGHIFEPFFTTKAARGAGLGLAVTYGIVTRNNGTLRVHSLLGQGTTMTVSLPLAEVTDVPIRAQPSPEAPSRAGVRPARALVVDDDPRLATLLAMMLQRQGHTVVVRTSAAEALEAAATEPFDVVLSDVGMPGMNGFELSRVLHERQPDLPIGLVSGWGESIPEHEWRAVGATGLLPKPFGLAEVHELLANLLQTPKA